MRTFATLVSLTLLGGAALGDPAATTPAQRAAPAAPAPSASRGAQSPASQASMVQLAPIDLSVIPEACKPIAKRALAPSLSAAYAARISLSSCMIERTLAPLELCDCGESIVAIDKAAAPAIALLDDVISNADPATQVIAEHTEGQVYLGFATRMLTTLPRPAAAASEAEVALCDMRKQTLEAQLAPWREAALTSFQHVVEIAKAHPELASNPVVSTAVRDSQRRLAAEVAAR